MSARALELRFAGSGGQGLQLSAKILAGALLRAGRTVALSQSYEPTSRGGLSRCDVVMGANGEPVDYPLASALDVLVLLDTVAAPSSLPLLRPGALVLADATRAVPVAAEGAEIRELPFTTLARSLGSERVANIVALGTLIAAAAPCPLAAVETVLREETPRKFLDLNIEALATGFRLG
ncbi:2-oxoglutarate oxidoreductase, gamma subunit [Rhodovastum atsumiense]|uniref:Pyruvate ferredoxin oxidoreductase n=1 Tax=Rhodovastum atsumiense TaxID=504468 RepID=A0A5M6ILP0_9PROT|nr:2-oxoacid:acceptor oxidoreductase family protein [Rhodovastum atsumiense]KAA5609186.1 pyruvate ferredoxin oxidoreductase [Rhodovastum atsumiense]CAH2602812.1 2-oxoglutarate oxidoreductase, gamma subunit [Rhodovastum atsumiense]